MRKQPLLPLMLISALLAPLSAQAGRMIGRGADSCETWSQSRQTSDAILQDEWVLGYLSGFSAGNVRLDPLDRATYEEVVTWVSRYCYLNRYDRVYQAADSFARDRHK
jgi:hypothetical protein